MVAVAVVVLGCYAAGGFGFVSAGSALAVPQPSLAGGYPNAFAGDV